MASRKTRHWPAINASSVYMPLTIGGGSKASLKRPATGRRPRTKLNSSIRKTAHTKLGVTTPSRAKSRATLSIAVSR